MAYKNKRPNGLRIFINDVFSGLLLLCHNVFALLGVLVLVVSLLLFLNPQYLDATETTLLTWLSAKYEYLDDLDAAERATAIDPNTLSTKQIQIANWLSQKYHVAPEPLSALVEEAYQQGSVLKLDPTLILAVMAIESNFNPYAQSNVGAQGLMQVMTKIHKTKYKQYGGDLAAFDPISNLRVGAKVLKECIDLQGSVEGGLKFYVGAGSSGDDGGYADKVLAEQNRINRVASGKSVAFNSNESGLSLQQKIESYLPNLSNFFKSNDD